MLAGLAVKPLALTQFCTSAGCSFSQDGRRFSLNGVIGIDLPARWTRCSSKETSFEEAEWGGVCGILPACDLASKAVRQEAEYSLLTRRPRLGAPEIETYSCQYYCRADRLIDRFREIDDRLSDDRLNHLGHNDKSNRKRRVLRIEFHVIPPSELTSKTGNGPERARAPPPHANPTPAWLI